MRKGIKTSVLFHQLRPGKPIFTGLLKDFKAGDSIILKGKSRFRY